MYNGLTSEEVKQRIEAGKVNGDPKRITKSYGEILRNNTLTYFNFINVVLFVIVVLSGHINNGMFMGTVICNALIGIYQECKSKKLLDQMEIMIATHVKAKRDNAFIEISVKDIVEDDLIELHIGQQIPVDGIIIEGSLQINESMLTGEAENVIKHMNDEIYAGTIITADEALVKVTRVGNSSTAAKIIEEAKKEKRAVSRLHDDLARLIRFVSYAIIPTGIILFLVEKNGLHLAMDQAALKTVAAVVGMIPEGLVVLTSVALAVSLVRLLKEKVLVQDLFSVESLARVDLICLDKTGTLTKGTMQVADVETYGRSDEEIRDILASYLYGEKQPNATSFAMIEYFGMKDTYRKGEVLPFSSDRKYAAAHLEGIGCIYVGAEPFLFPSGCDVNKNFKKEHTAKGERVIMVAHSHNETIEDELPHDLTAIATIAIKDVLRDNVQQIMQYFVAQGVEIRVISGDDPATVSSLALQAGIPHAENYCDLSKNEESMEEIAKKYTIFGRVLPHEKKELVKALQNAGYTVAMTGDGVNDVPALKSADVSIAMAAGSSAAKDSASIVLLDNDFARMPKIVNEGRRVINNISRAASMYLVKTVFSILLSISVILLVREYPFLPVHLTVISSFTVGIPTVFLQLEPTFEKVKGRFFANALRNAIPSAVAVFIMSMCCTVLKDVWKLETLQFYGMFVAVTGFIYLYTLYRVYSPLTKMRVVVIATMAVAFLCALFFAQNMLNLSVSFKDLGYIVPLLIAQPFLVEILALIYRMISSIFVKESI